MIITEKPFFQEVQMPQPQQLPGILTLCCESVINRREYDPSICLAVCCAIPAYLHRDVRFSYPGDINPQRPTLMGVTVAGFSSGKSYGLGLAQQVLTEVSAVDEAERAKEDSYKEKLLKASKKKEAKIPSKKPFNIRLLSTNTTPPAFLKRQQDLAKHGAIGVTLMPEIDAFRNFGSGLKGVTELLRNNFDSGELKAERVSETSISGCASLAWSVYACTTHGQLLDFLSKEIENGLQSRYIFTEIPEEQAGVATPQFKPFDEDFHNELKIYTDRLKSMKPGTYEVKELTAWVERERRRITSYATTNGDTITLKLSRRALLSAARTGFLLWITNGMTWSKEIDRYITTLYCQSLDISLRLFGDSLEKVLRISRMYAKKKAIGRPSLLPLLPEIFSMQDLIEARKAAEYMDAENLNTAREQLKNWTKKRLVKRLAKGKYQKLTPTADTPPATGTATPAATETSTSASDPTGPFCE